MEEVWKGMEKVWKKYGMDPAAAGPESGQSMEKVWKKYGKSMECPWASERRDALAVMVTP